MSPSPAISLDVSTTTTRFANSSATRRDISRSFVVFPTPGGPQNKILLPIVQKSFMQEIVPVITRPILHVNPIILP